MQAFIDDNVLPKFGQRAKYLQDLLDFFHFAKNFEQNI